MWIPHPALRATFSPREKVNPQVVPSPSGRGWPEGPGEGPTCRTFRFQISSLHAPFLFSLHTLLTAHPSPK